MKGRFQPWTGSSGPYGEQETLYNPERRVVRVLGKEYPLPSDGRMLILLIDELQRRRGRASVVIRLLNVPASTREPASWIDSDYGPDEYRLEESGGWLTALQDYPEIRAFMTEQRS